jgi:hypothetical protein
MKKLLITQSNYIPWKGYFDAINLCDVFVLYDDAQYTKRDWRNRNIIKTPQGTHWLTIPVEAKGKYLQKINETRVSDLAWTKSHWDTIRHAYNKAPYFQTYKDFFESLYRDCHEEVLSTINFRFLKAICELLGIKTEFRWSSEFTLRGDKTEKLLNLCLDLEASSYYSGPAAKEYLDVSLFSSNGIEVKWMDYSGYPEYTQLSGTFDHHVSIIDLIFNAGPHAKDYMKSFDYVTGNTK